MITFAIDPGACAGWAAFQGQRLFACGLLGRDNPRSKVLGLPDVVIVEIPEYRPHQRVPVKDLITLAVRAGMAAGEMPGSKKELVTPTKWKGGVPKDRHQPRILAELTGEECLVLGSVKCTDKQRENIIDAIGIGLWRVGRYV